MGRAACLVSLLLLCACVERRLWVRTDPAGAEVRVNGETIGKAPVSWRFDHYGTIRVGVRLEGYEPMERTVRLKAPWYETPGLDFFSDVVVPAQIHDDHEVRLRLVELRRMSPEEVERAVRETTEAAGRLRRDALGE